MGLGPILIRLPKTQQLSRIYGDLPHKILPKIAYSVVLNFFCTEKEKVDGEELKEWLKLVVAPTELKFFITGKQESLLPLQAGS